MQEATIILPHQLFEHHPAIAKERTIILAEHGYFFSRYTFHKHKLILHRASMQDYKVFLIGKGFSVIYLAHAQITTDESLFDYLEQNKITNIHLAEIIEKPLRRSFLQAAKAHNVRIKEYPSEYFLTPLTELEAFFKPQKKQYLMALFYQKQRKRLSLLVDAHGKPLGGKWSFDTENRKPLPSHIPLPKKATIHATKNTHLAQQSIDQEFSKNPGISSTFWYPTTHAQAKKWLHTFLATKLNDFGPYQDAIDKKDTVLFHSVLTPVLNIGLLTPATVVQETVDYAKKHQIPLASLEGFIRQIIGWREYMYGMYLFHGDTMQSSNYFHHTRDVPKQFWQGTTGLEPIDMTINHVLTHAYAHHIERLMVLGNFMLLCQYKPSSIFDWFMELFIDAYDWVMVPNVYGMSQYADGGQLATKPYISSSNYILKMSNYKKGDWCTIWDNLFWHFIGTHLAIFSQNPRCAFMVTAYKRMDAKKRREHHECAQRFLSQYDNN